MYELGSQVRRSSNSAPANVAEGFNNKHRNIYLQSVNRAIGEMRETQHHLMVAHRKGYLAEDEYEALIGQYNECGKMLRAIERSLASRQSRRSL